MKHKQSIQGFLSGVLVTALLAGAALPAIAAGASIWVDTGVKVYVNDAPIDAGDTHGNPDAFIYNGTTYVAVAAVSKSLGENVKWDGNTKSVYIGKHAGSATNLLDVCPPYQTRWIKTSPTITMAGTKYLNGLVLGTSSWEGFALFNLNGQYNTLNFTLGHIDGTTMTNRGTLNIYLDDKLTVSYDLNSEMLPTDYTLQLNYALKMKVEYDNPSGGYPFGMVNISVS